MPSPHISLIDDDISMLKAVGDLLRALGFSVNAYSSAKAFIGSPECRITNCVITDIQMPGLSGIELKRWLDRERIVTPVIMITARPESYLPERARRSGAICLLRKPFEVSELSEALRRAGLNEGP